MVRLGGLLAGSQWQGRARSSRQPSALSLSAASWYLVPGMCPKQLSECCRNGERGDINRDIQALLGSTGCLTRARGRGAHCGLACTSYSLPTNLIQWKLKEARDRLMGTNAGNPLGRGSSYCLYFTYLCSACFIRGINKKST